MSQGEFIVGKAGPLKSLSFTRCSSQTVELLSAGFPTVCVNFEIGEFLVEQKTLISHFREIIHQSESIFFFFLVPPFLHDMDRL